MLPNGVGAAARPGWAGAGAEGRTRVLGTVELDGTVLRAWADAAVAALEAHRAELDALNVFPVADSDTGTNL